MKENKMEDKKVFGIKLFIVFLIGIVVFFINVDRKEKLELIASIPIGPGVIDLGSHENSIIIWENDKLRKYKGDGSNEWEEVFVFNEPLLRFGEKNIYVSGKALGDIIVLNSKGETLKTMEFNTEIINLREENSSILVHNRYENIKAESLKILDEDGELLQETLLEGERILSYSINQSKDFYAITTLELSGDVLNSKVNIYGIDGKIMATNIFVDEIVLFTSYIARNKLLTMTDNSLYLLDGENRLWERSFQLVKDIYLDKNKINILYGNTLEILSLNGETDEKYSFTEEYNKIIGYNRDVIIYGDEDIIGFRNGKQIFKHKTEERIVELLINKENLIIIYEDKIDILTI